MPNIFIQQTLIQKKLTVESQVCYNDIEHETENIVFNLFLLMRHARFSKNLLETKNQLKV
jgi:hypothetical protein